MSDPNDILREIGVAEEYLQKTSDLAPSLLEEATVDRLGVRPRPGVKPTDRIETNPDARHSSPRLPENGFNLAGQAAAESDFRQNDEVLDERPEPQPDEPVWDLGYMSLSLEQQAAIEDAYHEHRAAKENPGAWMTDEDHSEVDAALLNHRPKMIDPLGDAYIRTTLNPRVQAALASRTPETRAMTALVAAQIIRHEVEQAFASVGML